MKLKDKIIILTGASSGLGKAIAKALVQKKATVYGLGRNAEKLKELKAELGNQFHSVKLDITDNAKITAWVKKTFKENHTPDVLINNAGIGFFKKIDETTETDWLNTVNTNLNGMYYITAQIVPLMKNKETSTHILNIGSILGSVGKENGAAYSTTKFGVRGFSDSLYKELRHFNIKVSCINPGSIETDFFKTSGIEAHHNMLHPEDIANTVVYVLETPDNMLIDELTVRPLHPQKPK